MMKILKTTMVNNINNAAILWATCIQLNIDISGDLEDRIAIVIGD